MTNPPNNKDSSSVVRLQTINIFDRGNMTKQTKPEPATIEIRNEDLSSADSVAEVLSDDDLQELRTRLEAARKAREQTNAALVPNKRAELTRDLRDEEALHAAIKQHGAIGKRIHAVYTDDGIVIVKAPKLSDFRLFQAAPPESRAEAMDTFVHSCLVYPTPLEYSRIEEKYPMIMSQLAGAASLLAGAELKHTASKS